MAIIEDIMVLVGLLVFCSASGLIFAVIVTLFQSKTFRKDISDIAGKASEVMEKVFDNSPSNSTQQTSSNQQHQNSVNSEMEHFRPIIDILCYFSLKYEPEWHKDKINFVKNTFIDIAENDDDIVYLRERMKLRNRPSLQSSIDDLNQMLLIANDELAEILLKKVVLMVYFTTDNFDVAKNDGIQLAKKINLKSSRYLEIINEIYQEYYTNNQSDSQQETNHSNQHKSEREKHAEVLGVPPNASEEEIKQAYRQKMKAFHPDRNVKVTPEVEEMIRREAQKINAAKDYLLKNR